MQFLSGIAKFVWHVADPLL